MDLRESLERIKEWASRETRRHFYGMLKEGNYKGTQTKASKRVMLIKLQSRLEMFPTE